MAGVYGDFLAYFSELFETFDVYRQTPDTVSGYTVEPVRKMRGIRQTNDTYLSAGKPKTLPVVNVTSSYILWSEEPVDVATEFVMIDGRMHRPVSTSRLAVEGGFYETQLDAVAGNDGTNDMTPELAGGRFA